MHPSSSSRSQPVSSTDLSFVPVTLPASASTIYFAHSAELLQGNMHGFFGSFPYVEHYSSVAAGGIAALACVGALEVGKRLSKNLARLSVGATRAAHIIMGSAAALGVNSIIEQDFSFPGVDPVDLAVGGLAGLLTAGLIRVRENDGSWM